jgi:carbon storage regulator
MFGAWEGVRVVLPSREGIMLVLTRKINESIVIDDDVSVLVVEVRGDRVRLGIEAPKDVVVHRKEVYDVIQETVQEKPQKDTGNRLAAK